MAGKDRERRLARQRYQRQRTRRAQQRRRTRRRTAILGAALAVAVVLAGTSYLGVQIVERRAAANTADCTYPRLSAESTQSGDSGESGGNAGEEHTFVGLPPENPSSKTPYRATVTTNRGEIVIDLYTEQAPCTTNSFRFLADEDFYADTNCHRLTTEGIHVLQCGDPSGTGRGGPGYNFADENLDGATYPRGTVAMANSGPDTNGSQFFVVYREGGLQPNYTPFGKVVKGLEIVEAVAKAGATEEQAPNEDVVIEDIAVDEKT